MQLLQAATHVSHASFGARCAVGVAGVLDFWAGAWAPRMLRAELGGSIPTSFLRERMNRLACHQGGDAESYRTVGTVQFRTPPRGQHTHTHTKQAQRQRTRGAAKPHYAAGAVRPLGLAWAFCALPVAAAATHAYARSPAGKTVGGRTDTVGAIQDPPTGPTDTHTRTKQARRGIPTDRI